MEIRKFAEEMMGKMKLILEKGESAMPIVFTVKENERVEVMGIDSEIMREQSGKDLLAREMQNKVAEKDTKHVVFISDAWVATVKKGERVDLSNGVKGIPGRQEAITCTIYGKNNDSVTARWRYTRDKNNHPVFEWLEWLDGAVSGRARFSPPNIVGRRLGYYILDEVGEPVEVPDVLTWGAWMEKSHRIVQQDQVGDIKVSTVFLGLDHSFGSGKPVLWETMIFGGPHDQYQDRYTSREDALKGHEHALALAKGEEAE